MKKIGLQDVFVALGVIGVGGAAYYYLTKDDGKALPPAKNPPPLSSAVRSAIDGSARELRELSSLSSIASSPEALGQHKIPASYLTEPSIFDLFKLGGGSSRKMGLESGESAEYDREFSPAKFQGAKRDTSKIKYIALHSTETTNGRARDVAKYFNSPPIAADPSKQVKTSAHVTVGEDGIYRVVDDDTIAYAVGPKDKVTLSVEIAGTGKWKEDQWMEHKKTLDNAARVVADWASKFNIPIIPLKAAELKNENNRGVTTHLQLSVAFNPDGEGHGDPGPGFPLAYVMEKAQAFLAAKASAPSTEQPGAAAQSIDDKLLADLLGQTTNMLPKS
jgi:hypothetical protein